MKIEGGGIARLAPILFASLLLHLAVIIAVTGIGGKDGSQRHTPLNMVVDYLEQRGDQKNQPEPSTVRHVTQSTPRQVVTTSAATTPEPSPRPSITELGARSTPMHDASASIPAISATGTEMIHGGNAAVKPTGAGPGAVTDRPGARGNDMAAAGPAVSGQHRAAYQTLLKRLIETHKKYPLAARRSGREGSCQRRFVLGRNGSLKNVEAISSCGHAFLDEAATQAIAAVGTFPPLPDFFKGAEETFTITMTFTLAR